MVFDVDQRLKEAKKEVIQWLGEYRSPEALKDQERRRDKFDRLLRQLREDLHRELHHGVRTVMAIDFSELHCYIQPKDDYAVVEKAFNTLDTPLIMAPAGMVELLVHLDRLKGKATGGTAHDGMPRVSALTEEAEKSLNEPAGGKKWRRLYTQIDQQWPGLFKVNDAETAMNRSLERLQHLQKQKVLQSVLSVVSEEAIGIDWTAYRVAIKVLTETRALGKRLQNHRDAINFAFVCHVNQWYSRQSKNPSRLVLWSRGQVEKLEYEPIAGQNYRNGDATGLVRNVYYAAARSIVEHALPPQQSIKVVDDFLVKLEMRREVLKRLHTESDLTRVLDQVDAIALEAYERNKDKRKRDLWDQLERFVVPEGHARRDSQPEEEDGDVEPTGDEEIGQGLSTPDSVPVAWEQLAPSQQVDIDQMRSDWSDELSSVDGKNGESGQPTLLEAIKNFRIRHPNSAGKPIQLTTPIDGSVIASIRKGQGTFTVRCDCPPAQLPWFCTLARDVIKQVVRHDPSQQLRRYKDKDPDGIIISSPKGEECPIPLTTDLAPLKDANGLWEKAQEEFSGDHPSQIRINTPYLNLVYEFVPATGSMGTAELESHLGLSEVIANFISRCTVQTLDSRQLAREFRQILESDYPLFEATTAD